ncbi:hypothetical protein SPRG_00059 [Saprolegnia parasitica CBS 223.65]|uniref:Phosphatidylinositol-3,4-bisphosphate 4-phosphatase n=1 Tax=Saprolegnia parasitica (strain CBS 223.65) TaxID=695850 RepID=A0A067CXL6_SAPPC|nr:hypothetical protein SPRG_00059 [Saprolegnia parasitica CBS 223.65]KDO35213.1 hypothetical protein SPRG_00059 [Saprolegnia parasitica CBS 223.65]|eukprot:XP_012193565.1 hypothetical protein SPRG_00059 [Saprolegnia parasitica CBS 223.65]
MAEYSDIEVHDESVDGQRRSSAGDVARTKMLALDRTIFVACRHLHLATPDATVYLPSQSMQRGLAYAKTMMQKQSGSPDFAGASFARVTIRPASGHPCVVRSVAQKGTNPSYVVGIALPESLDLETANCTIEIVACQEKTVLASTAAFPASHLLSSVSVPLNALVPTNPIDSNTPVVDVQHAPQLQSIYLSSPPFAPSSSTKYAFPGGVFLQEDIFEVDLATSIPRQVLEMALDETEHQVATYSAYVEAARVQECVFASAVDALQSGCDVYTIRALRARGLGSVPTSTTSTVQHHSSAANAPAASSRASVVAMAKSMRSSAFSKFKSLQIGTTDKAVIINAYCEVTISDPHTCTGAPWFAAKTNVITNSTEPLWRVAYTGAKVNGAVDADGHMCFYRPANRAKDGVLECKVYTKPPPPTSMSSAILAARKASPNPCLGTVKIPLASLLPSTTAADTLLIDLAVTATTASFPAATPMPATPPRYRWLDTLTVDKEPSVALPLPSRFLDDHLSALTTSLETTKNACAIASEWADAHTRFKSSAMKKTENVQALPTNLHVAVAHVTSSSDSGLQALPTVTCGLPAAHALGLEDTDLWALEEAIHEASAHLRTRLLGGLPATSSLATRPDGFVALQPEATPETAPESTDAIDADEASRTSDTKEDDVSIKSRATKSLKERSKLLSSLYTQAKTKAIALAKAPNGDDASLSAASLVTLQARLADLRLEYRLRKTMVMAQALAPIVSAFIVSVQQCLALPAEAQEACWEQWRARGYLIGWESLVSSQGKELHMLLDAWMALQSISRVFRFQLVSTGSICVLDTVVQVPLPPADFSRLPPSLQRDAIGLVVVLFTQGINEMQSLANMSNFAGVSKQSVINTASLKSLEQYMGDDVPTALRDAVAHENGSSKNTEILRLASKAVRRLYGGRVTCCKSGKDRTAMSVTWEQAAWALQAKDDDLENEDALEASDVLKMANVMREFGGRIGIAEKNVGAKRYSFNALQRKLLPPSYRPPLSTIQDMVTSVALRDS